MNPIQHNPGTTQFTCPCGRVVTFAPNSTTYHVLLDLHSTGPSVLVGDCPFCGQRHWRGSSRVQF